MTTPAAAQTGISVKAAIFPLAFLLLLFKTNVTIDGVNSELAWGEHFFPVAPGRHDVRVSFKYLFWPRMGENGMPVDVVAGQVVRVSYRSPFLVFMKGKISLAPAPPA